MSDVLWKVQDALLVVDVSAAWCGCFASVDGALHSSYLQGGGSLLANIVSVSCEGSSYSVDFKFVVVGVLGLCCCQVSDKVGVTSVCWLPSCSCAVFFFFDEGQVGG